MKCHRCGTEAPAGKAHCEKCGALLPGLGAGLARLHRYLPPALAEDPGAGAETLPAGLLAQCHAHLRQLLDIVASHLPGYLIARLARDPVPGRVDGEFLHGTLLFADISGFTAMAERLSRSGREGAEEITGIVNRYFDAMLAILRAGGGQLIRFGGDALLGLFIEPDSATVAARAALQMQSAMPEFAQTHTSQGVFPLRMKVALRRGRFFAAQLGTPQAMEFALFGADVNATARIESAAAAGQVLLDRDTLAAVQLPYRAAPLPGNDRYFSVECEDHAGIPAPAETPAPVLEVAATADGLLHAATLLDVLTPYLPAGLSGRLAQNPQASGMEGEHRRVAVLFAHVLGLGDLADRLGPGREADIIAGLNRYYTAMDAAVRGYGGVIDKFDLYDQGDKLLAFFGAPQAHEDDAERGVRAALDMQRALDTVNATLEWPLRQHVGLGYGLVFAGYAGTRWRQEYTVMGDEVNVAARLMAAAPPDAIVVSPGVQRKTHALFDLAPRGALALKGKSEPMPVYTVRGVRAAPAPVRGLEGLRAPLIGRAAEWRALTAALDSALAGDGRIVALVGEAGLGKSRLLSELFAEIGRTPGDAGLRRVEARCLSYTSPISYYPMQELVRQLAGLDAAARDMDALRQALATRLSPAEAIAALPFLATFLNLPLDEGLQDRVRYLDAEALQRRTFVVIRALLLACARPEAPLVVVVEDVQWIDQASRLLLEYLLPAVRQAPVLLVLAYRPERECEAWSLHEKVQRECGDYAVSIALQGLAPEESRALLASLVPLAPWPAEFESLLVTRAEGNPLYLEETLRALIEDGSLARDESGRWRLARGLTTLEVPDTLQGVLMTRLDRLGELSRQTGQVGAVIGRTIAYRVLSNVAPATGEVLDRSLVELDQHEITRQIQPAPERVDAFRHGVMQEVYYASLAARARRLYHCRIAAYLEAGSAADPAELERSAALIAHHAYAGQDWPRALHYQLLAGQQAQKLFANHAAIDHFSKALECATRLPAAETGPARLSAHAALGELLTTTGQYDQAQGHLEAALALAAEGVQRDTQARVLRWQARLHELRGAYPAAFEHIERGLALLGSAEIPEAAELRLLAGLILSRQGRYDEAREYAAHGLRLAGQLGEIRVQARASTLLGHIDCLCGANAAAVEPLKRAVSLDRQAGDLHGQALAHNQLANVYFNLGQWQAADDHYRQAREIFDQLGDVYYRAFADNNLGEIALNQGRLDEALTYYGAALRALERIGGSAYVLGALHNNLGATFVRRGDGAQAREHLATSAGYFAQAEARDFLPELHRHYAEAAALAGLWDEAEREGLQALDLARELDMRGEEGACLRVLGEVALARGAPDLAAERLEASLAIQNEVAGEFEAARSRIALARVRLQQGRGAEARALVAPCAELLQRLDAAPELAALRSLASAAGE